MALAPTDIASLTTGFLGLGADIGLAIPGLRKPDKIDSSTAAARAAAGAAGRAAVGGSQTGQGATRGLALRQGLRAASNIAERGAGVAAQAAAADEAQFQQLMQARNARLAGMGEKLSSTLSTLGAGLATTAPTPQAPQPAPVVAQQVVDPTTGLPAAQPAFQLSPEAQQAVAPQPVAATAQDLQQAQAPAGVAPPAQAQPPPADPAKFPALSASPQLRREQEINDLAAKEGIDPALAQLHVDSYLSNPNNPVNRLNPYS